MVTIDKIKRSYQITENKYVFSNIPISHYIETEEEFIKGIETLCNAIGEENLIAVQFSFGQRNEIDGCIITYKE